MSYNEGYRDEGAYYFMFGGGGLKVTHSYSTMGLSVRLVRPAE